jgi:hypothetical protein
MHCDIVPLIGCKSTFTHRTCLRVDLAAALPAAEADQPYNVATIQLIPQVDHRDYIVEIQCCL